MKAKFSLAGHALVALLVAPLLTRCHPAPARDLAALAATPDGDVELAETVGRRDAPFAERLDAARALVAAPPRHGQAVGLARFVDALAPLPVEERDALVRGVWSTIAPHLREKGEASTRWVDTAIALAGACTKGWEPVERYLALTPALCDEVRGAVLAWALQAPDERRTTPLATSESQAWSPSTLHDRTYVLRLVAQTEPSRVLALATDETASMPLRLDALRAVAPAIDPSDSGADAQLAALLRLAKSTGPSELLGEAVKLMKRFEPAKAVRALYELFDSPSWKVRYTAAMAILDRMSEARARSGTTPSDFLERLPATNALPMGLGEFHTYAKTIAALPPPFAGIADLRAALASKRLGARLTAIGYFAEAGTDADRATLRPLTAATDPVPRCTPADDCGWDRGCDVPKAGGAPDELESKPVATVGDYVRYCVLPQIDTRSPR